MAKSIQQYQLWQRLKNRLISFIVVCFLFLAILIIRLVDIQLIRGEAYFEESQRVITKVVALPAPRGELFDRNYTTRESAKPLISNTATLNLVAIPSHFKKGELLSTVKTLEKSLNLKEGELVERVTSSKVKRNEEIILIENLKPGQLTIIGTFYINFSKLIVRQSTGRRYNLGAGAAHLTG